jgi:arginine decarboxylase
MVEHGHELRAAELDLALDLRGRLDKIRGLHVLEDELLGNEASRDLDVTQVLMDVSATGTSGYQAADWLRENCQLDLGMSDHRRILATMSFADDKQTTDRLIDAMTRWGDATSRSRRPYSSPPLRIYNSTVSNCHVTRSSDRPRWCPPTKPPAASQQSRSRPTRRVSQR